MDSVLKKHSHIIKKIKENRIFEVKVDYKNDLFLVEKCDGYFCMELTKNDCVCLANLFGELADRM